MKKKKLKKNYLDMIPTVSEKISWHIDETDEKKEVVLEIPHNGIFDKIAQKLFRKPPITYVHLDRIGTFLWPLMDGEKTVEDLAQLLKAELGEEAEPLYPRIVTYFHNVESYGFVVMKEK